MNPIEEIKKTLKIEIRPKSRGNGYLEAIVEKKDLESLKGLLIKHLGPAAKEEGREAGFSKEIEGIVDSIGGLWVDQSFYYRQEGRRVVYAALWPWESNPAKITLKAGESELKPI